MKKITLKSHGKINLALDVFGVKNGYHLIQTVYQKIKLYDKVTIKLDNSGTVQCDGQLAKQAAELFLKKIHAKKTVNTTKGIIITIQKKIPYYSGLGGASSNAAAVLEGLNKLFQDPLSQNEIIKIAKKLGMDVPFFASGYDTALGTHFGEKITQLPSCPKFNYKFYFPKTKKSSTKDMYAKLDLKKCGKNKDKTKKLIIALDKQNTQEILKNLHNDFEQLWPKPKSQKPPTNRTTTAVTNHKFLTGAGPTWVTATAKRTI